MGLIYLLHFDRSYRHARHYLGYTENLDARLAAHRAGAAARWWRPRSATESSFNWLLPGPAIAPRSGVFTATATRRGGCAQSAASGPTRTRPRPP